MSTDSIAYFIIILATFILCCFSHLKYRSWFLISFSLLFLGVVNPKTSLIFLTIGLINYLCIKKFNKSNFTSHILVIFNISCLSLIKYIAPHTGWFIGSNYVLPIGISIFIFQQISFIVDVKHIDTKKLIFSDYLTYSFFLGNLTTGPILKFSSFIEQQKSILIFSKRGIELGIIYICAGLFKKMVVADSLSTFTSFLFKKEIYGSMNLIIPFLFNKYEVYANFSGFTDIAIGIGLIFGIELPQNFNRPFAVSSIVEFWKRWHMSLTAWIREYVFYPLTTSRFNFFGPYPIMAVTFLVFAIWHDLKITHITYGFIQVLLVYLSIRFAIVNTLINSSSPPVRYFFKMIKCLWFYVVLISIPGILFRAESMSQFNRIMWNLTNTPIQSSGYFILHSYGSIPLSLATIIIMEIYEKYLRAEKIHSMITSKNIWIKSVLLLVFFILLMLLKHNYSDTNFIYSNY